MFFGFHYIYILLIYIHISILYIFLLLFFTFIFMVSVSVIFLIPSSSFVILVSELIRLSILHIHSKHLHKHLCLDTKLLWLLLLLFFISFEVDSTAFFSSLMWKKHKIYIIFFFQFLTYRLLKLWLICLFVKLEKMNIGSTADMCPKWHKHY